MNASGCLTLYYAFVAQTRRGARLRGQTAATSAPPAHAYLPGGRGGRSTGRPEAGGLRSGPPPVVEHANATAAMTAVDRCVDLTKRLF